MKNPSTAHTDIDTESDYRKSHLESGPSYDAILATNPFDNYMARREHDLLDEIVPALFPTRRPRCLDFACGTGRITQKMTSLCAETTGVDISKSMLEEARQKCPAASFVQADLTKSDVDIGTFDVITSFRFFGNAQHDLRHAVLAKLSQMIRLNGYLIVNSHRNPLSIAALLKRLGGSDHGFDLHFFKLQRLLSAYGLKIVMKRPIGVWMYRSKLMETVHSHERAMVLEQRFGHSSLAVLAPDAIFVAQKISAA